MTKVVWLGHVTVGVTAFMLDMNGYGSLPPEKSLTSLRLFSERVMPHFK